MKEHGIVMRDWEVRAILAGKKTQARRPILPQHNWTRGKKVGPARSTVGFVQSVDPEYWREQLPVDMRALYPNSQVATMSGEVFKCPYGTVGDLLFVRETWATSGCTDPLEFDHLKPSELLLTNGMVFWYKASAVDAPLAHGKWRPSTNMPRCASRIVLPLTGLRAERLQDIKHVDAQAEGFYFFSDFASSWYKKYLKHGVNPWVWVPEWAPWEEQ